MIMFTTYLDDEHLQPRQERLAPVAPYVTPNDVPVPLRHTIAACASNGFTAKDLALIYELPEPWVELFSNSAPNTARSA